MPNNKNVSDKTRPDFPFISERTARKWTRNYREWAIEPTPKLPMGQIHASTFQAEHVQQLLAQPGAVGLRIYFGIQKVRDDYFPEESMAEPGQKTILVATDKNDLDILVNPHPDKMSSEMKAWYREIGAQEDQALILDFSIDCPPVCGGMQGLGA